MRKDKRKMRKYPVICCQVRFDWLGCYFFAILSYEDESPPLELGRTRCLVGNHIYSLTSGYFNTLRRNPCFACHDSPHWRMPIVTICFLQVDPYKSYLTSHNSTIILVYSTLRSNNPHDLRVRSIMLVDLAGREQERLSMCRTERFKDGVDRGFSQGLVRRLDLAAWFLRIKRLWTALERQNCEPTCRHSMCCIFRYTC